MKKLFLLLTLTASLTAHSQVIKSKTELFGKLTGNGYTIEPAIGINLLNVTGTIAKKDTTAPMKIEHVSGGVYSPSEIKGVMIFNNESKWLIKTTKEPSTFEVNGDKKEPIIFKINDTEYLIFNKKIYKLLN